MKGTGSKLFYIIILIIIAVIYFSGSNIKSILKFKEDIASYEEKLDMLQEENKKIAKELKWIETQDDYIKYLAKKRLGLVEPDEIKFYLVLDEEDEKGDKKD